MRLIDLDALMKYPIRLDHCDTEHGDMTFVYGIESVLEYAEYLPIIDAVPVIRCKDCKYYFKSDEKCQLIDTRLHFYETDKRWAEDSFCSWAERRGNDKSRMAEST